MDTKKKKKMLENENKMLFAYVDALRREGVDDSQIIRKLVHRLALANVSAFINAFDL